MLFPGLVVVYCLMLWFLLVVLHACFWIIVSLAGLSICDGRCHSLRFLDGWWSRTSPIARADPIARSPHCLGWAVGSIALGRCLTIPDASASDANGRLLDNGFFYVFDGVTDVLETSPRSWLALPDEAGAHRWRGLRMPMWHIVTLSHETDRTGRKPGIIARWEKLTQLFGINCLLWQRPMQQAPFELESLTKIVSLEWT